MYVQGYDPRGPEVYHRMFRRACDRFQQAWPAGLTLHSLELDSADVAHWRVEARGLAWQVATRYDFFRLERFVRADTAGPTAQYILHGLAWVVGDLVSGAQFRIFRASWRFGLHLLCFQLLLLAWPVIPAVIGLTVGRAVGNHLGLPVPFGIAMSLTAALGCLLVLRPVADRWLVTRITSCWVTLRRFARGRATWLDPAIDAGARHLIAAAQASDADELVVVGHSTGGVTALAVMARALELDPDVGRRGPPVVLLTLGSVMPAVALHPSAGRMRDIVGRLAAEPTVTWIDCQSRKDVMNFAYFDPVGGIGVDVGARRCNPLIWPVRFKDMMSPEDYRRLGRNFFRMHFQYIMAGDRPAPYDYVLLVAGPAAIADWVRRHEELSAFIRHGAAGAGSPNPTAGAASHP